jgi:ABC-2 type transport system ATP-binding protein
MMIRVQHLTKCFGALTAVNDISFEIPAGEIFAFLGPNGAGKTTTIKMLTTILSPTSGTIELNGLNPVERKSEARRHFGVVFQEPSLDQDLSARENMDLHGVLYGMPRKLRLERTETLLKAFELWDRKDSPVRPFSGGMKRRLEVARGLMHTPKILFLDEPTLGLDPQSRKQMWTQVSELNQTEGVTVFLTTHYLDEADRVASRIAVMDHGKIIALGSPRELKEQTSTASLDEAFLSLTGTALRDEKPNRPEDMRAGARMGRR